MKYFIEDSPIFHSEIIYFTYQNNRIECKYRNEGKTFLLTAESTRGDIGFSPNIISKPVVHDVIPIKKYFDENFRALTQNIYFEWMLSKDREDIICKVEEIEE